MTAVKHEWRKHEKELYCPKQQAVQVTVPSMKFLMLDGVGNPNHVAFADDIEALYSLSYGIKMLPKKGVTLDGYFDYTVYPLEALWKQIEHTEQFDKNNLQYRVMIRQPDFVIPDVLEAAIINVSKKKSLPRFKDVRLESIEDGDCVQILHVGSYDDEPESFMKVDEFCAAHNLQRANDEWHREIYLSDARKVEPAKLKTVLRVQVKSMQF